MSKRTRTLAETYGGVPSEDREAELAATTAAAVQDAVESIPDHGPDDIAAAAEIRTWFLVLKTVGAAAETKVMRACWRIRQAHPDAEAFGRFVHTQLDNLMTPCKAWLLADTWEVARKNRQVRELTKNKPGEVIAFVRDFTDAVEAAGGAAELPLPLDDDDREIVALLTAPPKKRREQLRELVAAQRERDRHPDDVRRIRELEAKQAAAAGRPSDSPADNPDAAAAVEALAAAESALFEARTRVIAVADLLPAHTVARVLRVCDRGVSSFDEITFSVQNDLQPEGGQ